MKITTALLVVLATSITSTSGCAVQKQESVQNPDEPNKVEIVSTRIGGVLISATPDDESGDKFAVPIQDLKPQRAPTPVQAPCTDPGPDGAFICSILAPHSEMGSKLDCRVEPDAACYVGTAAALQEGQSCIGRVVCEPVGSPPSSKASGDILMPVD